MEINHYHCWLCSHGRRQDIPKSTFPACLLDVIRNLLVISEQNSTVGPACCTLWGEACLNLLGALVEAYLHIVMALLTLRRIPSISTPPVSSVNPTPWCFFSAHISEFAALGHSIQYEVWFDQLPAVEMAASSVVDCVNRKIAVVW